MNKKKMVRWKYQIFPEGIKFYSDALYRGEIITERDIPDERKEEIGHILVMIINSYIEDKEDD